MTNFEKLKNFFNRKSYKEEKTRKSKAEVTAQFTHVLHLNTIVDPPDLQLTSCENTCNVWKNKATANQNPTELNQILAWIGVFKQCSESIITPWKNLKNSFELSNSDKLELFQRWKSTIPSKPKSTSAENPDFHAKPSKIIIHPKCNIHDAMNQVITQNPQILGIVVGGQLSLTPFQQFLDQLRTFKESIQTMEKSCKINDWDDINSLWVNTEKTVTWMEPLQQMFQLLKPYTTNTKI